MFQTSDNSQLLRRVLWINVELTIATSLSYKNTQSIYIFNRKNPQNSEPQNGLRRGLDFIALLQLTQGGPNQPKSLFLFHKNCSLYICIMTWAG